MHGIVRTGVLLAGALTIAMTMAAWAQQPSSENGFHVSSVDAAVTFSLEHAQVATAGSPDFWLKGGSADAAVNVYHEVGLAVNVTGEHASNIDSNNANLSKIAIMAGPRYTCSLRALHRTRLFVEGLFGGVHAFDSVFPASMGTTSSAGGFSMQLGGGVNIPLTKGFSVRALEVDYVHTNLPNNEDDSQNDFRLAFGAAYHFGKH
jgi:Outer membrane protein beta-barrel domain